MFKDLVLGQYIPANSLIHRLDPRTKIIGVGVMMTGVFLINTLVSFAIWSLWLILLVYLTKISPKYLLRGMKPILFIIMFTAIIHLFLTPGEVISRIGPLTITQEGVIRGSIIAARIFFLIIITSLLTLTTSPLELTDGLENLLKPFKKLGVPAHELAMMMSIALRFVPTLMEEAERIMKAQMARGMDFRSGSIIKRLNNLVPLMVPLFVSAFRRADELALAMDSRCYRGGQGRTRMKQLRFMMGDRVAFIAVFIVTTGVLIINRLQ